MIPLFKAQIFLSPAIIPLVVTFGGHSGMVAGSAGLYVCALFAALFYGPLNATDLIGKELSFFQYRHDNSLGDIFPIKGKVLKSLTLSGESDWLLVRLTNGFEHHVGRIEHVLIKRNDKQPIVLNKANQLVYFRLVPDLKLINEK